MRLSHYDNHPIHFDRDRVYDPTERHGAFKPHGFWVSVDGEDDWAEWCLRENFWPEGLACRHQVTLAPEANILHLDTAEGIDAFHAAYSIEDDRVRRLFDDPVFTPDFISRQREIDWGAVASHYDGLIIAPYQWSQRMGGVMWYGGWDCSSGVIWNARAIESVIYKPFPALEAA